MFHLQVASALREAGHDVVHASEIGQARSPDPKILEKSNLEGRVLVTLDEHFGNWAVLPLKEHPGVVRLKVHPATTGNVLSVLLPFLK